jgi:hypothetical protein
MLLKASVKKRGQYQSTLFKQFFQNNGKRQCKTSFISLYKE